MVDDPEDSLLALAADYRQSLRHAVYLIRSLDADGDLSTSQVSTLSMVADTPARVSEIARQSGVKVPSATEQIIKLENAGLVHRVPDASDARAVLVQLTVQGREALESSDRRRNHQLAASLRDLAAADRRALAAAIPAMEQLNSIIARANVPPNVRADSPETTARN